MSSRMGYVAGLVALYALGIGVAAFALYGCGEAPDPILAQAFGFQCTNSTSPLADKICRNRPPGYAVENVSRYCYKTIADANCFDRPDPNRKNQALGSSGY